MQSHTCTAFTSASLLLVCAGSIMVALPTRAARPDVLQPGPMELLRPAGTPWHHASVPPLTAQQLARIQEAVPDVTALPGAPTVPPGAWQVVLGVWLLLCVLARLALPLSVINRLFVVGAAELRSLQLDVLFSAALGAGGESSRLGMWSSVRLGSTPLSHALWQLASTARYCWPVLRAARWTLVAALVSPCLFYTESFLDAATHGIFVEALRQAAGKVAVGAETQRYAEALCVSRVRGAVRGDVLLASALTDLPLAASLLVLLSPALLRADSPLVALFHAAVAAHVMCLVLMRSPWRALPLLAAVARGDGSASTSSAPSPSEEALAAVRGHLAANGSLVLWLLPRLSARLAHRWLCAYALVNSGALHLSAAAGGAADGIRSPEAGGEAEEVGGPSAKLPGNMPLSPTAPLSPMHARIQALLAGRRPPPLAAAPPPSQRAAAASEQAAATLPLSPPLAAAPPRAGPPPLDAASTAPSSGAGASAPPVPALLEGGAGPSSPSTSSHSPVATTATTTTTATAAGSDTTITTTTTTVTITTSSSTPATTTKDLAIGYTTNPLAAGAAAAATGAAAAPPAVPPPPAPPSVPVPASIGVKLSDPEGAAGGGGSAPRGGAAGEKYALEYHHHAAPSAAPSSTEEGEKVALDFAPARP